MKTRVASTLIVVLAGLVMSSCGGGSGSSGGSSGGGGGSSAPSISMITPSQVMVGVPLGSLTISGQNFTPLSQVMIDGQPQPAQETSYLSPSVLQVYFGAASSLTGSAAVHQIAIQYQTTGATSNSMPFTVYAPQQGPFVMQATPGFLVGENEVDPTVIVAADVNGDGLADVVMPSPDPSGAASIAILYGQSNGTLSSAQFVPAGVVVPYALAVGDVDGNGTLDLVSITEPSPNNITVSVLLGDGHGNFQAPVAQQTFSGIYPQTATLVDLDGDGKLDLLFAFQPALQSAVTDSIVWLKNTGGSFAPPVTLASTIPNNPSPSVADFNGDGRPDILYLLPNSSSTLGSVHILMNQGNGNFVDQPAGGLNGIAGVPTVVDFNLDGIPDLVVAAPQGSNSVVLYSFQGIENGSFTQVASTTITGLGPFVAGDFDNDGFPDLADSGGTYYWGDGKGDFTVQNVVGPTGVWLAAGDFNGDGIPDVVIPDRFGMVSLSLGRKDRNYPSPLTLYPATDLGISVGDINGDGLPDVFVAGNREFVIPGTVFMNQAGTSFQLAAYTDPSAFEIADLTGKGVVDLMGGDGQPLVIWPNNGTPNFSSTAITLPQPAINVTVADMDGDGYPDIVSGTGQIFYGQGQYQFTPVTISNFGLGNYLIGDFNGDGQPDIVTSGGTFLNAGSRTFRQVANNLPLQDGAMAVVGDFNGDGKDDVALSLPGETTISIYYSAGDGTFYQGTEVDPGQAPGAISVGDFNGDGKLDLAVGLLSSEQTSLLFNSGNGQFTRSFFTSGATAIGMVTSDLNRDGKPDLVIGSFVYDFAPVTVSVVFHQ